MPNDNDGEDEERAEGLVRIGRCKLGWLQTFTAETINYEDHGDFLIVDVDELRWLENAAAQLATEFARYEDDTN